MRRFGIELEMVAPAGQSPLAFANSTVRAVGVEMQTNSHFGRAYEMWQAKPDGSIQPYDRGAEIVSRILPGNESSYREIRTVVDALDAAGFGVNRSCGFHVHVNVSDLPFPVRQLIVLRYAALQSEINAMMPPSRRGNSYCQPLGDDGARGLGSLVDGGHGDWPSSLSNGRYSVTNVQWAALRQGENARIEFRQAAATCNAAKVIGWVRFLQEMIDDVASRARGVTFASVAPVPAAPPRPVLVPMTLAGQVPTMRAGSDADRAMAQLCQTGTVTTQWAVQNGIADNVLRRIITGWRRHGAPVITQRSDSGPVYVLAGARTLPVNRDEVFAAPAVTTIALTTPQPTAPAPARIAARTFVAYPFNEGLTAATVAWCRDRRDTFDSGEAAPQADARRRA